MNHKEVVKNDCEDRLPKMKKQKKKKKRKLDVRINSGNYKEEEKTKKSHRRVRQRI